MRVLVVSQGSSSGLATEAEDDKRERQEQERLRLEAEERVAAQKAGGWLARFRT
ncbi:hypothetical protein ABZ153_41795 [Streptomyces sp. NPDC006290]|uniref:hypothetical protein n=1 Tax=Streptomyces sp. NPDC006290 TaxID=3156745 RepID=UPI0033BF2830